MKIHCTLTRGNRLFKVKCFQNRKLERHGVRIKNASFHALFKIQLSIFALLIRKIIKSQLMGLIKKVLNLEKFQIILTFFANKYNLLTSLFYNFKDLATFSKKIFEPL